MMQHLIMRHPAAEHRKGLGFQIQIAKWDHFRNGGQRISYPCALQKFQVHTVLMVR